MLAYVFQHRSGDSAAEAEYVSRLRAFHEALAAAPPPGFVRSWVWTVVGSPLGDAFEDWYLVQDWSSLGVLNDAAVSGSRQPAHDLVAPLAGAGAGGVYRLVSGAPDLTSTSRIRLSKPVGVGYVEVEAELAETAGVRAVWKRQMVLGPDAEFLIDGADGSMPLGIGGESSALSSVWPS